MDPGRQLRARDTVFGTAEFVVDHELDVVEVVGAQVVGRPPLMPLEARRRRDERQLGEVEAERARADREHLDAGTLRLERLEHGLRRRRARRLVGDQHDHVRHVRTLALRHAI